MTIMAMMTMISEVYEALSAENLASKTDINELKADNRLFRWMMGFNLAFTMAILWKILS